MQHKLIYGAPIETGISHASADLGKLILRCNGAANITITAERSLVSMF